MANSILRETMLQDLFRFLPLFKRCSDRHTDVKGREYHPNRNKLACKVRIQHIAELTIVKDAIHEYHEPKERQESVEFSN
jgi:hypothetical protein